MAVGVSYITNKEENIGRVAETLAGYEVSTHMAMNGTLGEVVSDYDASALSILDLGEALTDVEVLDAVVALVDQVPVLVVLKGSGQISEQLVALIRKFSHGKLDVLLEPFTNEQLKLKVRDCIALFDGSSKSDGIMLESETLSVRVNGDATELTRMEFELFRCLTNPPGRICTREHLIERLHQDQLTVTDRSIDQHIKNLRKKLNGLGVTGGEVIKSVYGVGYRAII